MPENRIAPSYRVVEYTPCLALPDDHELPEAYFYSLAVTENVAILPYLLRNAT